MDRSRPEVRHSRLNTGLVPMEQRFALFRDALSVSHQVTRLSGDDRPFEAVLDAWLLGGMFLTAGRQTGSRIVRAADRTRVDGLDHFTLMHLREGRVTGEAGGQIDCGAGGTMVFDATQPSDVETSDNRNIGLRLPRTVLLDRRIDAAALHGAVLSGMGARMLGDHLAALVRYVSVIGGEDLPFLTRATAALVRECLAGEIGAAGLPGATRLRDRVTELVDRRIGEVDLDAEAIGDALGVTRSRLYRALPGGVDAFVRGRRLERAHALLCDPEEAGRVAEIGYRVGFLDPSRFSTAFRRRYGCSPTAFRQSGGLAPVGLETAYRRWLAMLARQVPTLPSA